MYDDDYTFTVALALTDRGFECMQGVFDTITGSGSSMDTSDIPPGLMAHALNHAPEHLYSSEVRASLWLYPHVGGEFPMLLFKILDGVCKMMNSEDYDLLLLDNAAPAGEDLVDAIGSRELMQLLQMYLADLPEGTSVDSWPKKKFSVPDCDSERISKIEEDVLNGRRH